MIDTHRLLKLTSGEEIVCDITANDEKNYIKIINPLKLVSIPSDKRGVLEERISFCKWVHFCEDESFKIDMNKILVITKPEKGLSQFYEYCLDKLSKYNTEFKNRDENLLEDVEEPTDQELDEIEEEIVEKFRLLLSPSKLLH